MGIEKIKHLPDDMPGLPWLWQTGVAALTSWAQGARQMHDWLQTQAVSMRDAVVVVPQVPHVLLAKQAWSSAVGGWMPRFETAGSLLQRLPVSSATERADEPLGLMLDETLDLLWIQQQLRQSVPGRQWLREAPAHAQVASMRAMALAHEWLKVCLGLAPDQRAAWVAQTRAWCVQQGVYQTGDTPWQPRDLDGVGARERWLTGQTLAWAMLSWPSLAHRHQPLFEHEASAWVLVTVGTAVVPGSDAFVMQQVLKQAKNRQVPVCWMPACWAGEWSAEMASTPIDELGPAGLQTLTPALHFNDEAQAAAAWVLAAVHKRRQAGGRDPVVLVTQDRVLSRRVRALLMPHESSSGLVIQDESGWTLSTTRAAAAVTRLLAAAQPSADTWTVLDWLTHGWANLPVETDMLHTLKATDVAWRQQQVTHPWRHDEADGVAHAAWPWARQLLMPLHALAGTYVTLSDALACLADTLQRAGVWDALLEDEAGQSVLKALRLTDTPADSDVDAGHVVARHWQALSGQHTVNLTALTEWVQQCLGGVNFEPQVTAFANGQEVDVVMTPMGRAVLRPFACVIMPGVDEGQLGVMPPSGHLLGVRETGLGLPAPHVRWQSQWAAFALLAAQPEVRAVYRQSRDGGPMAPSAWLGRWWSLAKPGTWHAHHWPLAPDPRQVKALDRQLTAPILPHLSSPGHGPDPLFLDRLSPSAYQRLRDCPYRYFALDLLRLRQPDEQEEGMARQDYGNWLHEVLRRFHAPELDGHRLWPPDHDLKQWLALADEVATEQGLHDARKRAHLALYQSSLPALAAQYVAWHHEQQVAGWYPRQLEQQVSVSWAMPPSNEAEASSAWQLTLYGKLDRVDAKGTHAPARVIDYKTGSFSALKKQISQPLEDTQLGFYALLLAQSTGSDAPVSAAHDTSFEAMYLHLHPEAVSAIQHPDVESTAEQMADGIRADMMRIRQGHPMPALGEGPLCDRCEARGLCRKDHQAGMKVGQS